jgi:hypothetical protein
MARDYRETIRALRAKAADSATPEPERKALNDRADELEAKHSSGNPPFRYGSVNPSFRYVYDTTVTGRDGFTSFALYDDILANLLRDQWAWNPVQCEGCDAWFIRKPGTPPYCEKCSAKMREEQDIVEEQYRDQPDEDYGYDIKEGDDW